MLSTVRKQRMDRNQGQSVKAVMSVPSDSLPLVLHPHRSYSTPKVTGLMTHTKHSAFCSFSYRDCLAVQLGQSTVGGGHGMDHGFGAVWVSLSCWVLLKFSPWS